MTDQPKRIIYRMKFRPLSLCWFLANRLADSDHADYPSISRSVWLSQHLPRTVVLTVGE